MAIRQLNELLELIPEAALVLDAQLRVRCLNERAESWLEPRGGEAVTERLQARLGADGWLALQRWLSAGVSEAPLLSLRLGSGQGERWVEAARKPLLIDACEHSLITLRDRHPQQGLTDSERGELHRLRAAILARSIGVYEHDHTSDEIYGSLETRRHYGLSAAQPLSIGAFAGATHPDDAEFLVSEIAKAHDPDGDGSFEVRHRIRTPAGETRWLHTCATTYFQRGEDGVRRLSRTVGSTLEITQAHAIELETRRLAAILAATPDVVATTDLDGTLTYLNRAGRELVGIALDAPAQSLSALQLIAPALREQFDRVIVPVAIRDGSWRGELELHRAGAPALPASVIVLAHQQTRSLGAYLSIIARDLTAQKELEAQLLHAQKLEAVGRLAGGIAHDFNNLLSVIIGFATLARREPAVPESARAKLDEVLRAAARAGELTVQLLSFSRKQVLRPRVFEVAALLSSLEPMVRRLLGESIEVSVAAEPAGRARIKADRSRMEQVIMNLVVNARDAMPKGGRLRIEAQLGAASEPEPPAPPAGGAERQARRDRVVIVVSDTGHGMSSETMSRIFEPFFTTKVAGQGTGLGLSTVFGIVKQSGGNVRVVSELGRGTSFHVELPISEEPLPAAPAPARELKAAAGGAVLVVEDEPQLRQVVLTVLRDAGYQPLAASGPEEALEIVRARGASLRLLLTDIVMPGMSGKRMVDRLAEEGSRIPVLYMSGYPRDTIVHHGVLDPGVSLLAKPFTPEQLVERVTRAIGEANAPQAPQARELSARPERG